MRRYLFRPDLSVELGVGHVMRCLALAERLMKRGDDVTFACDPTTTPWVGALLEGSGISVLQGTWTGRDLVRLVGKLRPDGVVLDSYTLSVEVYEDLMEAGPPVLALVDSELRGARGHLLLDQNIGAEEDWGGVELPPGVALLGGVRYALVRQRVLDLRPPRPPRASAAARPRVLAFFGGSDALGVGPEMATMLASLGLPLDATVITRSELIPDARSSPDLQGSGAVTFSPPVEHLPQLIRGADLVLSAAGSSSWELAALGAACAVVAVADNQQTSFRRITDAGAMAALGSLDELRSQAGVVANRLHHLLTSVEARQQLHDQSWRVVDGMGADRVVVAFDGVDP